VWLPAVTAESTKTVPLCASPDMGHLLPHASCATPSIVTRKDIVRLFVVADGDADAATSSLLVAAYVVMTTVRSVTKVVDVVVVSTATRVVALCFRAPDIFDRKAITRDAYAVPRILEYRIMV
jgi:hypothetical protein